MMKLKSITLGLAASAGILGLLATTESSAADLNTIVGQCESCHGKDGNSTESDMPAIGGLSAEYISANLADYKKKARPCPETKVRSGEKKGNKTDMCQEMKDLSDADIKQVSQHYAGKKFARVPQKFDPELAKKGKVIHNNDCEKCHSNDGTVASDDAGILAGQRVDYLTQTFEEYASGKRSMEKKMKPKIDKLKKPDFDALVNYYGSFK
jgi:sulfide dehydrogenase cytochrome subunit